MRSFIMVNNCIRVLLFTSILYISCISTDDIISSADQKDDVVSPADPIEIISPQENTSFEVGEKIIFQFRQTDVGDLQGVDVYLDEQKIDITQNSPLPDMLSGEHKLKLVRGGKVIDKVIFVVVEKDVPEDSGSSEDSSKDSSSSNEEKQCATSEEHQTCSNTEVYHEIWERNARGCTTDDDCVFRDKCNAPKLVYNRANEERLESELAERTRCSEAEDRSRLAQNNVSNIAFPVSYANQLRNNAAPASPAIVFKPIPYTQFTSVEVSGHVSGVESFQKLQYHFRGRSSDTASIEGNQFRFRVEFPASNRITLYEVEVEVTLDEETRLTNKLQFNFYPEYVPDRMLLGFEDETAQSEVDRVLSCLGGWVIHHIWKKLYEVGLPEGSDIPAKIEAAERNTSVKYASPDFYIFPAQATPNPTACVSPPGGGIWRARCLEAEAGRYCASEEVSDD